MLQNGGKAGIGIMDLIVDRDDNGNHGMALFYKTELSVGPVGISNLHIPFNQVPPFLCCIEAEGFQRMEYCILGIKQQFPLSGPFGEFFVKDSSKLPSGAEGQCFMTLKPGDHFPHIIAILPKGLNNDLLVGHMIVSQALFLLLPGDEHILFPNLHFHLGKSFLCLIDHLG